MTASTIWKASARFCLGVAGVVRHCEEGRERRVRILQITYRLTNDPMRAMAIMGIRIASA
jgi:hypothetical protein